jgi:hypothetical protein
LTRSTVCCLTINRSIAYTNCWSIYCAKMVLPPPRRDIRAAYDFKLWWVNEIYEGGIEQTARGTTRDRIYFVGRGYTPKERGLTYYWEPVYELSKEVDFDSVFEEMPNMKWTGFQLMAIEKEGGAFVPVVQVRIDYGAGTSSLFAAKKFVWGDVVTVLSVYEADLAKKVLIFGGRCSEPGDITSEEGGKTFNAMITHSHTIRCMKTIRRGEEIVVNYEMVAADPLNFLDRVVRSREKDKAIGRIVGFEKARTTELFDIEFEGTKEISKCRRGQVNFVYLR